MENGNIILWKPTKKQVTNIEKFRREINRKYQLNLENYKELWKWSVEHHVHFWKEFWIFSSLKYSQIYKSVVETEKGISEIPEWFSGSRLNFAENLLCRGKDSDIALYVTGENETVRKITYLELRTEVAHLATALKNNGVQIGDRVVGYVPNCELAIIAMLATSSIGAVWSSTSPEFGVSGVLDRFKQIHPKIIFSVEAVVYNGKTHNHLEKLKSVVEGLPDLEKVVLYPFVNKEAEIDISQIPKCVIYNSFICSCDETPSLDYQQLPFNHPLYIMYSSGTTGPPKCMVHSAGGALIQHLKEHMLHGNLSSEDILMYYTTTGWMMWNWMVSSLAVGASIVCYDGSPLLPKPDVLWDLVDSIGITVLGCGARWIEALEEKSISPINTHNLASLHTILSTGSPLKPESFDYVYTHIKKNLMLGSITGGTDIISCFAGQNPTLPVYRGEIQSANLGMAVHCFDKNGESVTDKPGELVCTRPFPSMPTRFWNDANSAKYQKSYFEKFPGVWCHGDYCQINSTTGGIVMLGRSDGVLNPNGVRFGSAEIYNVVMSHTVFPEISDALCVGQVTTKGERVVLFLKITNGFSFSEDLRRKVRSEIRLQLSARHVPEKILETPAIPYTASGKKVEIAVKKIINGEPVEKRGALVNPESLDFYFNLSDLSL